MDKQFCIFDMDGTLLDSMPYWRRLNEEYLCSKGVQPDARLQGVAAMTMLEGAAYFIETYHIPGPPQRVVDEIEAGLEQHYRQDIPLKPGVDRYLQKRREQGCRLCVATATALPLARLCLERLGVADLFDFILSCESIGVGKTSPDIYQLAARRWQVAPEEIAVFEDALYAARTAKEAGFYTVGVWEATRPQEWEALCALADETVTDWRDAL